jgi:uncharacterized membrane protein
MKSILKFLKTTLLGGIFFLLPLILILLVLQKALAVLSKTLGPVAKALPFSSLLGIPTPYLAAGLIFILIGFFAGMIAKTSLGKHFRDWAEHYLDKIPGYSLVRVFAQEAEASPDVKQSPVALVNWGNDNWQWCFIVERHGGKYVTIFIPGAPKPTSGAVRFLPASQVKEINVSMATAIKCLTNNVVGSLKLLREAIIPKGES